MSEFPDFTSGPSSSYRPPKRASTFATFFSGAMGIGCALVALPLLAIGGCLMLAGVAAVSTDTSTPRSSSKGTTVAAPAREQSGLTIEKFERIEMGLSESAVEAILGMPGKENASNVIGEGTQFETNTKMVTWSGGFKSISVTFQNGKAMSKVQFGL